MNKIIDTMRSASSRIAHYARQVEAHVRRSGVRKTSNVVLVEVERMLKRTHLRGKPYYYFIDPCDACNLRCPLCATGNNSRTGAKGMLKLADFSTMLKKIAPYAVELALYSWGEPFLNPDIFAMIQLTRQRDIRPVLSSNLNITVDRLGERLVESGLEKLIISVDGVTQETYAEYRVRGNLERVLANIRAIVAAKRRLGSALPVLEWQFIVFRHNAHEIEAARAMATELGCDTFRVQTPYFPPGKYPLVASAEQLEAEDRWMPPGAEFSEMHPAHLRRQGYLYEEHCFFLYRGMFVTPRGEVNPCCFAYQPQHAFSNLLTEDLNSIWNNAPYQQSRALFTRRSNGPAGTLCDGCFLFKRPQGIHFTQQQTHAPVTIELYEQRPPEVEQ